ncbi:hypothetical protein [Janthinobacterium fluminis]|uniref:Flagellin n=1 Tax=Janthinobacterium fluminis TaxID=2987524 RepID=A0ABT5JUP2_9BURK|nr:hypothetical protein [Janthinobacterium fluminis]MDC8756473.1 hypothetical protein [Janthinobacterium fluminis]
MQIAQLNLPSGIASSGAGSARVVDEAAVTLNGSGNGAAATDAAGAAPAPLRRGLSNWDHQLQGDISSAQQALDFLEQSTSQLQALKSELAAKLAARQGREGQVEARVRQFSNTWRSRQRASGGTLDAQLQFNSPPPATQQFRVRGLNLANLQNGAREVLAFSVGGASQSLRSVNIEPGLSAEEIVQRFDRALAPSNIRVSADDAGELLFSTAEGDWPGVRDTLSVRGGGIRFPTGQMNRVSTEEAAPAIAPDNWGTEDIEALRNTLQQVMHALAQMQQARDTVRLALAAASSRVATAQPADAAVSMDRLAAKFSDQATKPGYESLLAITSALVGISRERVLSLLGLR